jgi:ferredoxin
LSRRKWCQIARAEKEYTVFPIKVAKEKCDGYGQCLDLCPVDVFEVEQGNPYPVDIEY